MNLSVMNKVNPFELENIFFSLDGQKISNTNEINRLYDRLTPEVAYLLMSQLYHYLPDTSRKVSPLEDVRIKISDTIPPESNNNPVQTAISSFVQKSLEKKEVFEQILNDKDEINEFTIYESGVALGIVVCNSTKEEVFTIMKNYSKIGFAVNDATHIHFYSDISLYVFFNENNIVQELKFVNNYKGKTSKGLMLGDSIQEAIIIYGQPKMKSPKGAFWNKFSVFCDQDIITSIRIHK